MDGQTNIPPPPSGSIVLSSIPPPPSGSAVAAPPPSAPPAPMHGGLVGGLDQQPATPEGTYQMHDASGHVMQIPFSNVRKAAQSGMLFVNKDDLRQYARDYAAKPIDEGAVDHYLRTAPWWDLPSHVVNALQGIGSSALDLATHNDRPAHTIAEQRAQLAAATPSNTTAEGLGEVGENVGEFFSGEELMGLLGRTAGAVAKGFSSADKLKDAGQLATMLGKHPIIAKLLRVGVTAAKNGTITGTQTAMHTGDPNAAMHAAEFGAAATPVLEMGSAALKNIGSKLMGTAPAAVAPAAGAPEYAAEARAAVKPTLEKLQTAVSKPAIDVNRVLPAAEEAGKPLPAGTEGPQTVAGNLTKHLQDLKTAVESRPAFNIDETLNQVHDFTGASERLAALNQGVYDAFNDVTGGKFKVLNNEANAAQRAGNQALYQSKLSEIDTLLKQSKVTPELQKVIRDSWRQSYQLRDFGAIWDRSLNGVPGSTQASQAQRGIDGKTLMNGLQRAVKTWGRGNLEATLGQGRLENLENIARLNQTAAKRMIFNRGMHAISQWLPVHIGGGIGAHVAGLPGYIVGAGLGATVKPGSEMVLDAIRANPKIGQFFTYAIDSGADPKAYGPMIARMISEQSQQSQQQEQGEKENAEANNQ